MTRRLGLAAVCLFGVSACGPADVDVPPPADEAAYATGLRAASAYAGMQMGSFVNEGLYLGVNPTYAAIAVRELSAVAAEWSFGWVHTEPSRGSFDFKVPDQFVARAIANGQQIKGHPLVWHVALPQWLFAPSNTFYNDMMNHIAVQVGRYKGKIAVWNVVNEAFNSDGTLRNTIFLQKIGPAYISSAFRGAHTADTAALLYYNDYGIEGLNAKSDAVYKFICGAGGLRAQGVPIHGIGFQMRIKGLMPYTMYANIQRFRQCGLQVDISEMAIDVTDMTLQRSIYWDAIRNCIYAGCRAVMTGSLYDGEEPSPQAPMMYDRNLVAKPSYYGAMDALYGTYWRTIYPGHDHSITFLDYSTGPYQWENNGWGRFRLADARHKTAAMKPIYLCKAGGWDHFLSAWSNCEGQQVLGMYGYGYSAPGPGLVAINRCLLNADHFHSRHSSCEGFKVEGPIFYSP